MVRIWINIFKCISNPRRSSEMLFLVISTNCRKSSARAQCMLKLLASWAAFLKTQVPTWRLNPCACKEKHFWSHDTARVSAELVFRHWSLYTWVSHKSQDSACYQTADFKMPLNFFTRGIKCFLLLPVSNTAEHATGPMDILKLKESQLFTTAWKQHLCSICSIFLPLPASVKF